MLPTAAASTNHLSTINPNLRRPSPTPTTIAEGNTADKGHKKREAVRDQAKQIKVGAADEPPKVFPKNDEIRALLTDIVTSNVLFSSYAQDEQAAIVDAFESFAVPTDTLVIRQGEMGDNFYVVESGSLDIYIKNSESAPMRVGNSLGSGSSFGELALMYNTPRAASIKTTQDCVLWRIDRSCYRSIVVRFKHMRNRQYLEFLRNVEVKGQKLGGIMSDAELEKMTVSLERESFEEGEAIVRQGNKGDHFFIIAVGDVGVYKHDADKKETKLAVLHVGDYFGEKALLSEDVRQASCIAESRVTCLTLGRYDFIEMIGTVDDMIQKMHDSPRSGGSAPGSPVAESEPEPAKPSIFTVNIGLADLEMKSTLGCGAFGRVKLCKSGDKYFALKCQAKKAIQENGLEEHVLNEMRIMCKLNHPLIAKLHCSMQDSRYIYFLLELLQGGELFTYLRNSVKISEPCARFYAASVISAIASLHEKRIAYRDLKPENLVFDEKGYIKLVDFGLAKVLTSGKTWTLCGTPDYLAPEIILNEGHDLAVDYWALGILIFEMVVGIPPFYAEDPMEVYEKVCTSPC